MTIIDTPPANSLRRRPTDRLGRGLSLIVSRRHKRAGFRREALARQLRADHSTVIGMS